MAKFGRRRFLAGLLGTASVGLAGCGGSTPSQTTESGTGDRQTATATQISTSSPTPTSRPPENTLELVHAETMMADSVTAGPDSQIPWFRTRLHNVSNADHGSYRLEYRIYEEDDTLLDVRKAYLGLHPAKATLLHYQRYYIDDPGKVGGIEVKYLDADPTVSANRLTDISVQNSDMTATPEAGVDVVGEVKSPRPLDRLFIIALVFDSDGVFRGTIRGGVETDVSAGESVAFSGGTIGIRTPPDIEEEVTDFDLRFYDGFP